MIKYSARLLRSIPSSLALAGAVLYSTPVYSQDLTSEQKAKVEERIKNIQDPEARERARKVLESLYSGLNKPKEQPTSKEPSTTEPVKPQETPKETDPLRQQPGESLEDFMNRMEKEIQKADEELEIIKRSEAAKLTAANAPIIKLYREPRSELLITARGGATPNGSLQGSHGDAHIRGVLQEYIDLDVLLGHRSSSFLDQNNRRTIFNSPANGSATLGFDFGSFRLKGGLTASLEEILRRDSSFIEQDIGTSHIQVFTRAKIREISEYYSGLAELQIGNLNLGIIPYGRLFPTIIETEITEIVTDPNPAANYTTNARFRQPSQRNKMLGFMFNLGAIKEFSTETEVKGKKEIHQLGRLYGDLIGFAEREDLDVGAIDKRQIERIYGGMKFVYDAPMFIGQIFALHGYLDDRIGDVRLQHDSSGTKVHVSGFLDFSQIRFGKTVKESDDPKIEEIIQSYKIPVILGASFNLDVSYEEDENFTLPSGRVVAGVGKAFSGRRALEEIANTESLLSMIDLNLAKQYGSNLSEMVRSQRVTQLPLYLIDASDWTNIGLMGIASLSRTKDNRIGYEWRLYGIAGPLSAHVGALKNSAIEGWETGLRYHLKDYLSLGVSYGEFKDRINREQKTEPLIAAEITFNIK
ncbi:MAG: hypothetical protein Q8R00_02655 [Candidatus Nanoarchaeia archaeon]|nr:hypothetical protein [Candidatus Nanoarchaeia archaeon]